MNKLSNKKTSLLLGITLSLLLALFATPVLAQSTYSLNVRRDFGYGSGEQIRGNFTLSVVPTNGIQSVTYWVDDQQIGQVSASPFSLAFQTESYSVGEHQLKATIQTTDGQSVTTAADTFDFVSSEEESAAVKAVLVPIIASVLGIMVIVILLSVLLSRGKGVQNLPLGAERSYGFSGGAICPKCHRPFPLSLMSINAGFRTKFTRCPFCGKWSLMKIADPKALHQAEIDEIIENTPSQPAPAKNKEEALKEMIDNSRYMDH